VAWADVADAEHRFLLDFLAPGAKHRGKPFSDFG
jgi:hypothetical protein